MQDRLERFLSAQQQSYQSALTEIRNGKKASHWMWYIFPQLKGLGSSQMAIHYGIENLDEAKAYLAHPTLGKRLVEISTAALETKTSHATTLMGSPDDLKLRSCMTLFSELKPTHPVFQQVLDKYFKGEKDHRTLALLTQRG